jgi:hypothetical protein
MPNRRAHRVQSRPTSRTSRLFGEETDIVPGEAGILALWVGGEPARRWACLDEAERIERCLHVLEALYPDCRTQLLRGVSIHWGQEPFSMLGYPSSRWACSQGDSPPCSSQKEGSTSRGII